MKPANRQKESALSRMWGRLSKRRQVSWLLTGAMVVVLAGSFLYQRMALVNQAPLEAGTEEQLADFVGEGALPVGDVVAEPGGEEPALAEEDTLLLATLHLPLIGPTAQGYAPVWSTALGDWRWHEGMDLRAPKGTPVHAAADGVVTFVGERSLDGLTVEIDHQNGLKSQYSGLQAPLVATGDTVEAGQALAEVGDPGAAESGIGPHLHFAVEQNGALVDPRLYLP